MSHRVRFRISVHQLYVHSALFLAGVILASVFICFSPDELLGEFFEKFENYFNFSGATSCIILILKECFWLLLIGLLGFIPHGRLANILILLYKGFSIGVVSSIACSRLGIGGLKYTFFLILPPNLLYILSLCIATQISFEITAGLVGRHSKDLPIDRRVYLICVLLTVIGGLLESYYVPWMYKILF